MKNKNVKIRIINNTLKDHNGDIIAVNRKPWERYNRKNIILEAKKGSTILEVIKAYNIKMHYPIIASKIDNIIKELNTPINKDCRIELLDLQDRDGVRIYRRGVEFIMVMAVRELIVDADPVLLHSLSRGVYCELQGLKKIDRSVVNRIEARMKQIVKADLPFIKKQYSKELASEF